MTNIATDNSTLLAAFERAKGNMDKCQDDLSSAKASHNSAAENLMKAWENFIDSQDALNDGWEGESDSKSMELLDNFHNSKDALKDAQRVMYAAERHEEDAQQLWQEARAAWKEALNALTMRCSVAPNPAYHDIFLKKVSQHKNNIMVVDTNILPHHDHGETVYVDIPKLASQLWERGASVVIIHGFVNQQGWQQYVCVNPKANIDLLSQFSEAGALCEGSNEMIKVGLHGRFTIDELHETIEKATAEPAPK